MRNDTNEPTSTRRVIIGERQEFPDGRGRSLQVDGRRIAVFRVDRCVFAIADRCPHRGFPLHDGRIRVSANGSPVVECRTHGATFDLETGRIERGPARQPLTTYKVSFVEDRVEIEIPTGNPARE